MKRIFLFFIAVFLCAPVFCNTENNAVDDDCHVIISIDMKQDYLLSTIPDKEHKSNVIKSAITSIKKSVVDLLKSNNINNGYVSVNLFGTYKGADINSFIKDINTPFTKFDNVDKILKDFTLEKMEEYPQEDHSILSIAKPYSLYNYRNKEQDVKVQKTYMVVVSDNIYNGNNDYYGELTYVIGNDEKRKSDIMKVVKDVQQNYFYEMIDQRDLKLGMVNGYDRSNKNRSYIYLFEVVPMQNYLAMESFVDFPHEIVAKRTKSGYIAEFYINELDNPNYDLESAKVWIDGIDIMENVEYGKKNVFNIPDYMSDSNVYLNLKTWVHLLDGVYNHTILSPDGDELQGSKGLNRKIKVQFEEDEKIWNIITLNDKLYDYSFWSSSQEGAALGWEIISGFIILLIASVIIVRAVVRYIRSTTRYVPRRNDTKI